jgi:hypothetical protein
MNPTTAKLKPMMPGDEKSQDSNILEDAESLWSELQGLGYDHFQLAALETRRAGESLVAMLIAGVMVAILLIGAWLGILAAAVLALIGQGLTAGSAIGAAVAVNLLLVLFLAGVLRRKSRFLQWPALLRSLQPKQRKPCTNKQTPP